MTIKQLDKLKAQIKEAKYFLKQCEERAINGRNVHTDELIPDVVREFWAERGVEATRLLAQLENTEIK